MKKLILLLLILPIFAFGQDIQEANQLKEQAEKAYDSGNLDKAMQLLLDASKIYEKAKQWDEYLDCGVALTTTMIDKQSFDQAIETAEGFINKAKAVDNLSTPLSLLHKNIGKVHYIRDDYKSARPALEQALIVREKVNPKDPDLARDYGNLGIVSRFAGRHHKAIEYIKQAIKLQDDADVLARLYSEIGVNYRMIGNFRKALDNINQSIRLLEKGENKMALALAYTEKGAVLTELKRQGEDIVYFQNALNILQQLEPVSHVNIFETYKKIATSYFQFSYGGYYPADGLDSAIVYYEKALRIAQEHLSDKPLYLSNTTMDMADVYAAKNKLDKAKSYLAKTEEIGNQIFEEKSMEASAFFGTKMEISILEGAWGTAINDVHQRLIALLPNYSDADVYKNPPLEDLQKGMGANDIQNAVAAKARTLYNKYRATGDKKDLDAALNTIMLFDELINSMRADFSNSGTNIAWSDITLDAYENAIEICLAKAKESKDEKYKQKAFFFSEKSKGLTLLEAFQSTKANNIEGIDLDAELDLKLDIADLEQEIFQLRQASEETNDEKIKALEDELFTKREQYSAMIKAFEEKHPEYFNAKYKLDVMDVADARSLLNPNQALVEYFVGDSAVYAFKITKDAFDVFQLDGEESMGQRVYDFRESIYGYFLNNKERNQQMMAKYAAQYTSRGHSLYQKLFKPLGELPKRLIIVPAGAMCDMPFEALLTKNVKTVEAFQTHPYLVKDHIISYAYSATLLKEMRNRQHSKTEHTYLGFAPSFADGVESLIRGKTYTLAPLKYNSTEINNIHGLLGEGTVFEGEEATENKFKSMAKDYSVIHFATHGLANNQDPDYSLLAFTEIKDDKENEFLYVSDLYNTPLNAELVVLSACETALGKNYRGEGIMSLARGFSYAGAKSIFTTLWSVNDQATFQIVERFYRNLQGGMAKDEALQKAKVDFISQGNDLTSHPFLWSPYIMVGDMSAIKSIGGTSLPWGWMIGGVLAISVVGLFGMRVLNNKN